jgi:hypothetical protein
MLQNYAYKQIKCGFSQKKKNEGSFAVNNFNQLISQVQSIVLFLKKISESQHRCTKP